MMSFFNKYDWRTKNRILWVCAMLFGWACYQLAVRPTFQLYRAYHELREGEAVWHANKEKLEQLRASARRTGELLGDGAVDTSATDSVSEPEKIALFAQRCAVNVRRLPAPELLGTEAFRVAYMEYQVAGRFAGLLRLLRIAEREPGIQVVSADFKQQPNPVTRMPELILRMRTVRLAYQL